MEKRHHVHVCYAPGDLVEERSVLMQRLAKYCFFTWSLENTNSVSSAYTRQQIDECDYVIFLVGGRYGILSVSGVSYLHLDFIYASTKKKSMIVMLHANPEFSQTADARERQHQRKLTDFRAQLEKHTQKVNYFSSILEFTNKLVSAYNVLSESHPRAGWVRVANESMLAGAQKFSSQQALNKSNQDITGAFAAVNLERVGLNDVCRFNYQAHAFEGGNFTEVIVEKQMAWGDLLSAVADKLKMPVAEDMFAKALHERMEKDALKDVKAKMPNAHAATRCQIATSDLSRIKAQFFTNDWLKVADARSAAGKRTLMLTPQGARHTAQWQSVMARMG